ncbi:MAG: alpha-amylase family glycosyl hydrolase [Myxococcota bacterium]
MTAALTFLRNESLFEADTPFTAMRTPEHTLPVTDSIPISARGSRRDAFELARQAQARALVEGREVPRGPLTDTTSSLGINHPRVGPFSPLDKRAWGQLELPTGVHIGPGAATFAVRAPNATAVVLEIYDKATGNGAVFDYLMRKTADGQWQAKLNDVPAGTHYAFRCFGPNWNYSRSFQRGGSDAGYRSDVFEGHRFNPNKITTGSHAPEISHEHQPELARAYLSGADSYQGRPQREFDTGPIGPKAVAVDDHTPTGQRPRTPWSDTVVYESSVRGLTDHKSATRLEALLGDNPAFATVVNVPEELRGTYAGAALIAPYLKGLGITSLELMPIHQFDSHNNAWGYMTQGFFAPNRAYAHDQTPGGPTREFKEMVRAFHDAGIEVFLDVVYNHAGWSGPPDQSKPETLSLVGLRALDNQAYHALSADDPRYDHDTTGCGGPIDASKPDARALIRESLEHWISLGVDGFRFDLAAALGRVKDAGYAFDRGSAMLNDISELARTHGVKLLAEPWDLAGYHLGDFPEPFSEWNGQFRDRTRDFVRGAASASDFTAMLAGSPDRFGAEKPSINFITVHDGFTLADLVSYDHKLNRQEAPFGPSDGGSDNNKSWSHHVGDEVQTARLRRQQIRNLNTLLMFARGVPMVLGGDELGRTQRGNNNTYSLHQVQGINYDMIPARSPNKVNTGIGGEYHDNLGDADRDRNPIFEYTRELIELRRAESSLKLMGPDAPPIEFRGPSDGSEQHAFSALYPPAGPDTSRFIVHANSHWHEAGFQVPEPAPGKRWARIIDTHTDEERFGNRWPLSDAASVHGRLPVRPRSVVVLQEVEA